MLLRLSSVVCVGTLGLLQTGCVPPLRASTVRATPPAAQAHSNGIAPSEAALLEPLSPLPVTATPVTSTIVVTWSGTGEDLASYHVFRRVVTASNWQRIGIVTGEDGSQEPYHFQDFAPERSSRYVYGVAARDASGHESAISESNVVVLGS